MDLRSPLTRALLGVLLGSLIATAPRTQGRNSDSRPNVLLILADDLGFSDLGCFGGEIPTPNLDRLARGGARFSQFYNSARCCPSRASLLTGLHPHQAGVGSFATRKPRAGAGRAYAGHLLDDCATLAEQLGDAGYSTWMVGKWHLGVPGPIERGFDHYWGFRDLLAYSADQWDLNAYARLPAGEEAEVEFDPASFYATDAFADQALAFLDHARSETPERPWFLYLAHSSPHFPVQAPAATIDRHVEVYRRGWDALREERLARMQDLGLISPDLTLPPRSMVPVDRDDIANGYPGQRNPAWDDLPPDRREDLARRMATFAAMVEHLDRGVGRLLEDLTEHGELDDTLILFLSDNGACYEWGPFGFDGASRRGVTTLRSGDQLRETGQRGTWQSYGSAWAMLGNTPLNLYKHFCHEGGIASPLLMHWGERIEPATGWIDTPTHLIDIVPTVLQAAEVDAPQRREDRSLQPLEGMSLLPLLAGKAFPERSLAFEHQRARALRRGPYKAVWGKRMPADDPHWELYDLRADRSEQQDLSGERPELTAELAAEWDAWAERVGAEPFTRDDHAPRQGDETIAGRNLEIRCRIDTGDGAARGVVVAQGGREHGFAVHLLDGVPCFDVRRDGLVTRLRGGAPVRGVVELIARLDERRMSLATAAGTALGDRSSPGLISRQPTDPRDTGRDTLTAAGDYDAPNPFTGEVLHVEVRTTQRPHREAEATVGSGLRRR